MIDNTDSSQTKCRVHSPLSRPQVHAHTSDRDGLRQYAVHFDTNNTPTPKKARRSISGVPPLMGALGGEIPKNPLFVPAEQLLSLKRG